jgi:hypothetical protein
VRSDGVVIAHRLARFGAEHLTQDDEMVETGIIAIVVYDKKLERTPDRPKALQKYEGMSRFWTVQRQSGEEHKRPGLRRESAIILIACAFWLWHLWFD